MKHIALIEQRTAERRVSQHIPRREERNGAAVMKHEEERTRIHHVAAGRKREWSTSPAIKKDDAVREDLAEHEIAPPSNGDIIPHSRHFCAFAPHSRSLSHVCVR